MADVGKISCYISSLGLNEFSSCFLFLEWSNSKQKGERMGVSAQPGGGGEGDVDGSQVGKQGVSIWAIVCHSDSDQPCGHAKVRFS